EERVNQLRRLDQELETILTSFDTSYAWNYGNVKEGLRDLYEKAKRDQWNGTTQLPWDTDVDPERGIIPDVINPLAGYPRYENLKELLDTTITDSRWDFKYLGMQIIIEGLAMAAFGNLFQITQEPLLKELIRYVMKDESRHVAFGMLSLADYYRDMNAGDVHDREDFIVYACELMRNRLIGDQIASATGWDRDEVREVVLASEPAQLFRRMIFARVVPNLKRLGLLTQRVRAAFDRLAIL